MIRIFALSREGNRLKTPTLKDIPQLLMEKDRMFWADLEDPTDEETGVLNGLLGFHSLAVEDCLRDDPSPKLDDYGDYIFLILKALDSVKEGFGTHPIGIFLGDNFLVSFHKQNIPSVFNTRGKVVNHPEKLLESPERLLKVIIEGLMADFPPAVERFDQRVKRLENGIVKDDADSDLTDIPRLKREILSMRRLAGPQRDALHGLRNADRFISPEQSINFRGALDRMAEISERSKACWDMLNGLTDSYILLTSVRLKKTLRNLTAVVGFLLPLGLIAGFYGLNNDARFSFLLVFGVAAILLIVSLTWLIRKKWF